MVFILSLINVWWSVSISMCFYGIMQSNFSTLKSLCTVPFSSLLLQPLAVTDLFYCLHSFVFSRMPYSWNHINRLYRLFRLTPSLSNMHLRLLHGLMAYLFFAIIISLFIFCNTPLFGCSTIYLHIHLLKDILVASNFWQSWIKLLWISVYRFLCRHIFNFFA